MCLNVVLSCTRRSLKAFNKKSCAVSGIATCFWGIKKNITGLAESDIKAVCCFEALSFLRGDAMHQHFVRAKNSGGAGDQIQGNI